MYFTGNMAQVFSQLNCSTHQLCASSTLEVHLTLLLYFLFSSFFQASNFGTVNISNKKNSYICVSPIHAGLRNHLTKYTLASHPKALCNDGTPAVYYTSTDQAVSGDVLIYLEVSSGS